MDIETIWNYIANIDTHSETDGTIGRLVTIVARHLLLYLHGTAHRPIDAVENHEQRIPARIDDPPAVLGDGWVNYLLAEGPEPFKRSDIVQANQAAVTNHVGMDDGYQLPP